MRLRQLKIFGPTLAVLAGSALLAPAASGAIDFHAEADGTVLTGVSTGSHVLSIGAGEELNCKSAALLGSLEAKSEGSLTLAPAYGECKFKSGGEEFTAHVNTSACAYVLTATEKVEEGHLFSGPAEIKCEGAEGAIQVSVTILGKEYECLKVESQKFSGTVDYTWEGSGAGRDLKLSSALSKIKYSKKSVCGEGSFENGAYSGATTLQGEDEAEESVGFWVGQLAFHSKASSTTLTGSGLGAHVFKFGSKEEVTCKTTSFAGSMGSSSADSVTLTPTYGECKFKGPEEELVAHVHMESCSDVLIASEATEESTVFHGSSEIACEKAEDEIKIGITLIGKEYPCFSVPAQETPGTVNYTAGGSGSSLDLSLDASVSSVEYVREGVCGEKSHTDGAYSGEATLSGDNGESKAVGIFIGVEPPPTEGVFTSGSDATTITVNGSTNQVLSGGEVQYLNCASFSASGSMGTNATKINLAPVYGSCTTHAPGSEVAAEVDTNGCNYVLNASGETDGSMEVSCPSEQFIAITAFILGKFRGCLRIYPQEGLTVDYTNETVIIGEKNVWNVSPRFTFSSVTVTKVGSCGATSAELEYAGEVTMKGENEASERLDVTWDPE